MFVCKTSLERYKKISIYSDHDWHFSFHGSDVSREKAAWAVILLVVCRERMSVSGNVCVGAQWDYKPLLHEASAYRIYSSSEVWQSLLSILVWHLLLTILFLWIVLIFSFYLLSTVTKISFFLVSYYRAWHIVGAMSFPPAWSPPSVSGLSIPYWWHKNDKRPWFSLKIMTKKINFHNWFFFLWKVIGVWGIWYLE